MAGRVVEINGAQRFLQPNDEELNNMLRSIKGEGPIRLRALPYG